MWCATSVWSRTCLLLTPAFVGCDVVVQSIFSLVRCGIFPLFGSTLFIVKTSRKCLFFEPNNSDRFVHWETWGNIGQVSISGFITLLLCSCSVIFHLVLVLYMKELWKIFRNWTNWITEWKHRQDKLRFIEKADWLTSGSGHTHNKNLFFTFEVEAFQTLQT